MRKVIPYIASQYRKDKIWLRRTKKSKRQYQILLAIDDSSSMSDNKSKQVGVGFFCTYVYTVRFDWQSHGSRSIKEKYYIERAPSNISYKSLRNYLCKVATVITETLAVTSSQTLHCYSIQRIEKFIVFSLLTVSF